MQTANGQDSATFIGWDLEGPMVSALYQFFYNIVATTAAYVGINLV